jgi:hypothetical protein
MPKMEAVTGHIDIFVTWRHDLEHLGIILKKDGT